MCVKSSVRGKHSHLCTMISMALVSSLLLCSCSSLFGDELSRQPGLFGKRSSTEVPNKEPNDRRVEKLPNIMAFFAGGSSSDETGETAGDSSEVFSYGEWEGVVIEPERGPMGDVEKVTVTFLTSDFECTADGGGHSVCESRLTSFFAIENDGRLEKRANKTNAKTMEIRMNGTEFELEADLGSVDTVETGAFSYPIVSEKQASDLEEACLAAGGGRKIIEEFDRNKALELLGELGIYEEDIEEVASTRSVASLKEVLDEACLGIEAMSKDPTVSPTGLVVSPVAFSTGYRWAGRLAVGERVLDVEVEAGTSVYVSLQSAAGEGYELVPDQYRFSPQGSSVTVVIGWAA